MSGKNAKKLLIVLRKDDFSKDNEELLNKVLLSIGFNREEDCLSFILSQPYELEVSEHLKQNNITKVISFGIPYSKLGYSILETKFHCFTLSSRVYLLSSTLGELSKNQSLKRALWNELKENYLRNE